MNLLLVCRLFYDVVTKPFFPSIRILSGPGWWLDEGALDDLNYHEAAMAEERYEWGAITAENKDLLSQ